MSIGVQLDPSGRSYELETQETEVTEMAVKGRRRGHV